MIFFRFVRSKVLFKFSSDLVVVLIIFCLSVYLFGNILMSTPIKIETTGGIDITDKDKILNEILSNSKKQTSNHSIFIQTPSVSATSKKNEIINYILDDYNQCSFIQNEFLPRSRVRLLKEAAVLNLKKYFNINNLHPFENLCDVTFTVKTTKKYHDTKLPHILDTWISDVSSKVCISFLLKFDQNKYEKLDVFVNVYSSPTLILTFTVAWSVQNRTWHL